MRKQHKFNTEQFETNMVELPEVAYTIHQMDGSVILIKRGESGFWPIDTDKFPQAAAEPAEFVKSMNRQMGVKPSQAEAMKMASMFGWDLPGASPKAYLLLDLIDELDQIDPALGERAKELQRNGAGYDEVKAHFRKIMDEAARLREPA